MSRYISFIFAFSLSVFSVCGVETGAAESVKLCQSYELWEEWDALKSGDTEEYERLKAEHNRTARTVELSPEEAKAEAERKVREQEEKERKVQEQQEKERKVQEQQEKVRPVPPQRTIVNQTKERSRAKILDVEPQQKRAKNENLYWKTTCLLESGEKISVQFFNSERPVRGTVVEVEKNGKFWSVISDKPAPTIVEKAKEHRSCKAKLLTVESQPGTTQQGDVFWRTVCQLESGEKIPVNFFTRECPVRGTEHQVEKKDKWWTVVSGISRSD